MNWIITIYIALLFFVLTPGVLLRIPRNGKPMVVAAVHAVVFALIWHFSAKMVWKASVSMGVGKAEGFSEGMAKCPKSSSITLNGDCGQERNNMICGNFKCSNGKWINKP
jgi:hypothetical protein